MNLIFLLVTGIKSRLHVCLSQQRGNIVAMLVIVSVERILNVLQTPVTVDQISELKSINFFYFNFLLTKLNYLSNWKAEFAMCLNQNDGVTVFIP